MKPSVAFTLLVFGLFCSAREIRATGFVLNPDGTFTTITIPGGGYLYGINDSGQIVGDGSSGPLVYSGGVFTPINVSGYAWGINNEGQISGSYQANFQTYGFIDTNGSVTTIDVPGSNSTVAYGINSAGQATGSFTNSTGDHSFVYTNGLFTTFDVPGATGTLAARGETRFRV